MGRQAIEESFYRMRCKHHKGSLVILKIVLNTVGNKLC